MKSADATKNISASTKTVVETVDKDIKKLVEDISLLRADAIAELLPLYSDPEQVFGNKSLFEDLSGKSKSNLEKIKTDIVSFVQNSKQQLQQFNDAINNAFARAISTSIQVLVTSLAKGENALANFAKAFLGVLGDLAIQLGTLLIAGGQGLGALFTGNPAGAIGFGVALVAIGALLKTLSSDGLGTAGVPPAQDAVTAPIIGDGNLSDGLREAGAAVQVNIQGDVFDSEETGLRIADILKDQGFSNAVVS
jgi:hypothetical protein